MKRIQDNLGDDQQEILFVVCRNNKSDVLGCAGSTEITFMLLFQVPEFLSF